ncbi:type VI secretion system substrate VgrG1b [Xenorhabdus mauleonii]|uniref:Type VI secretion system secreted protein VgrG n=1 Tax=Xenorhabdus mauleonii TaxID=351675 RepID=A0A1I3MFM5_9GAMM|nr:type VI secretion system tip protein TssI/VgrG [Xenorhabdus mauleonii]PHM45498.1 type VI secretion system substrate VgrG1b [Xenorhabdus mauleonii]SFI95763.1 type VI secretion system secreted protein VgrG [Xenorhabdus mauleonii]
MEKKFIAHTSLPGKSLFFKSLNGIERLSDAYEFEIQLLSEKRLSDPISLHKTTLTIEIRDGSKAARFLSGYIDKISYSPFYKYDDRLYLYTAIVRPNLWKLKQTLGYGIWQDKTVPDIISEILNNAGIDFKKQLIEKYRTWEYCVKHNESDFDFIHRLMEHEGIYYYFKHDMGSHTMILVDSPQSLVPMPDYENIRYFNTCSSARKRPTEYIDNWNISSVTIPQKYSLDDYDFRKPRAKLFTTTQTPISALDNSNIFIWPGHYIKSEQGQFYSRIRQQASEAKSELIDGKGNVLGMAPGHTFTLVLPNDIKGDEHNDYLITGTHYYFYDDICPSNFIEEIGEIIEEFLDEEQNKNVVQFEVIPANTPWKPSAVTPWPKVMGLETAIVTGPKDKKIWTDKYGRIKVKFRWDRDDKQDDTRSCWIRVATRWAGWRYGSVCIPRVGEEVIISFVNGDPDKPLVIGSTYNDENMPPWELPKHETRVGIMSNTKGGKHEQANYLFLDDEPDKESFDLHAERDMNISVEKNKKVTIDGDRTTEIKKEQKDTVTGKATFTYKADHETTIDGKNTLTVKKGQQETISDGLKTDIKGGRKTTIDGGDTYNLKGNLNATINGNWMQSITGTTTITSPNVITIHSDNNVVIDCPQHIFSAKLMSVSIVASSASMTGNSTSTTSSSTSVTGTSISSKAIDISDSDLSRSQVGTKLDKATMALDEADVAIKKSRTNISNSSLHIIS